MRNLGKLALLIALFGLFSTTAISQPRWLMQLLNEDSMVGVRQIRLLESTKSDLFRIFGQALPFDSSYKGSDIVKYYETPQGRITATFVSCIQSGHQGDVVEEISISPSKNIPFESLNLPRKLFERSKEADTPVLIYSNLNYGVVIEVQNRSVTKIALASIGQTKRCK